MPLPFTETAEPPSAALPDDEPCVEIGSRLSGTADDGMKRLYLGKVEDVAVGPSPDGAIPAERR
jgi:hypothetical protein